ncbi:uncharacterized protein LOC122077596 isoform X2 [Macadamia integrifolia]|uniref:uncharacterized protein LOC122077596 isoform X2 n=1 Tax=Macadamia integrifolia TaxID=60698 RepID=UPI001C501B26|nr:uncharacterized protein LOC122077596 isoform X2 [Macadamia integrifolia]
MAGHAVSLSLIFSSFLLLHAHCLQPNQPENLVVKWISSSTNDLPVPDSSYEVKIFPSNYLTESAADPKMRLPSQSEPTAVTVFSDDRFQPNPPENQVVERNPSGLATSPEKPSEDAVPSVIVTESKPTDAIELPGSDAIRSSNEYGFHFHFNLPFGFHFHSYCHHHEQEKPKEESNKKQGFHFDFRFPFAFHFHLHCHHHEEKKEMEKQFEPRIAGEGIPNGDGMIKARTAGFLDGKRLHHHKLVGNAEGIMKMEGGKKKPHKKGCKKEKEDGDQGMMRFEEGKKKPYKKEWKKEKEDGDRMMRVEEGKMKRHKKEWKKEKEDGEGMRKVEEESKIKSHKQWKKKKEVAGLVKLFQKFFKHFRV